MAVRRTAAFGEVFNRSTVRRPTFPNDEENRGQPLLRARPVFDRERFGERLDQDLAERHAHRLHPLELRVVDRCQVGDDVTHHRAGDEHVDRDHRVLAARLRAAWRRFADDHVDQLLRGVEVADEKQVSEQRDDRPHQLAPALFVLLDAQQIEQQREIERAQRARGDGAEPRADAVRRIVADLFDLDRLRSGAGQLAAV